MLESLDLLVINWHSGIVKLDNNNNWEYKASYRNDCIREDELADLVYLRSGDKRKAFGVITNRRANYFTLGGGECVEDSLIAAPLHTQDSIQNFLGNFPFQKYTDSLRSYGAVFPRNGSNRLQLRYMKSNLYSIDYYSPHNLTTPIDTEVAIGPTLNLDFPDLDTLDIILFTAKRNNINFKRQFLDSIFVEEVLQREVNYNKEVAVYPNPNDGDFVVNIESPADYENILILDSFGRELLKIDKVVRFNQFSLNTFDSGVYIIQLNGQEKSIKKRIVIQ